jgi:hypothetical protein
VRDQKIARRQELDGMIGSGRMSKDSLENAIQAGEGRKPFSDILLERVHPVGGTLNGNVDIRGGAIRS